MKKTLTINASAVLLAAMCLSIAGLAGCDAKPAPPRMGLFGRVKTVEINPQNTAEYQAVMAMEHSRAIYEARLIALHSYYRNVGHIHKIIWAYKELENMRDAKPFTWQGATIPPAVDTPAPPDATEGVLAERLVQARLAYQQEVAELASYYERSGQALKVKVIRNMQDRLDPIRTYMYIDSAEYPPLALRPRNSIPQADALFQQAVRQFRAGKGLLNIAITTNYTKQREALRLFQELIRKYPTSSKIAMSAYYVADIYKEYFDEDLRAVNWYERAYTWLPTINEPARFQAATVYDLRLNDKLKAIELYQAAIDHEQFNRSNVKFALDRIPELRAEAEKQRRELRRLGVER